MSATKAGTVSLIFRRWPKILDVQSPLSEHSTGILSTAKTSLWCCTQRLLWTRTTRFHFWLQADAWCWRMTTAWARACCDAWASSVPTLRCPKEPLTTATVRTSRSQYRSEEPPWVAQHKSSSPITLRISVARCLRLIPLPPALPSSLKPHWAEAAWWPSLTRVCSSTTCCSCRATATSQHVWSSMSVASSVIAW